MPSFGAKLLKIRRDNLLSGEAVAEKLRAFLPEMKVSKQHISNWEKRMAPPSQDIIDAYSKAFNITEADIRGLNNSGKPTSVLKNETSEAYLQEVQVKLIASLSEIAEIRKRDLDDRDKEIARLEKELATYKSKLATLERQNQ